MSIDFYKNIIGFQEFAELSNRDHYSAVPVDWYAVITDIKGSTQAIADGRYKDVNLTGAAAIMSILNISREIALPYAFGGDGANLLIPPELLDKTRDALAGSCAKVKSMFDLDLRAGCVPMQALYDKGTWLSVAKFQLSPNVSQAVFQGTALALAEAWVKKGGGTVITCEKPDAKEPDLQGLECRWQPIENRNGEMLSLLARVTPGHADHAWRLYAEIIHDIESIYPDYTKSSPTYTAGMHLTFSPASLIKEAKLRARGDILSRLLYLLRTYVLNSIGQLAFSTGKNVGTFDGTRYLSELVANSDARKFDEMLRMVLDSTPEQHTALTQMLEKRRQQGEITYGIHVSSQALMTCLVFSLAGDHVHFIDGADGGYALAAKQMKQQDSSAAYAG